MLGQRWPETSVRQDMLEEAIEVIRLLWRGGRQSHHGRYYTVENARLYSLPEEPPPLLVAAGGPGSARLAARLGDGLIGSGPDRPLLDEFRKAGGAGKPCYGEVTVCFDESEERARDMARELWPIAGLPGPLMSELPLPSHFEKAAALVGAAQLGDMALGPDPERHVQALRMYLEAGYDRLFVHQIGPNQEPFMQFYERDVLPRLGQPWSSRR